MVSYASSFKQEFNSCDVILGSGSCLLVSNLLGCDEEPPEYTVTSSAAIAVGGTSATLTLTSGTRDGVAIPAIDLPANITLRDGSRLYTSATDFITIKGDTIVPKTGTVTATIEPAATAIAANATAKTWALLLLDSVSALDLDLSPDSSDFKRLKDALQKGSVKTAINYNLNVTYYASSLDLPQAEVIFPAANSAVNIFGVAVKTTGTCLWGRFQVTSYTEPSNQDITEISISLQGQPLVGATQRTANPKVNSPAQLIALNNVLRLSGVPTV